MPIKEEDDIRGWPDEEADELREKWAKMNSNKTIEELNRENEPTAFVPREEYDKALELVSLREAQQDVMAADTVRLLDQIEYQNKAAKDDHDKIKKLEFEFRKWLSDIANWQMLQKRLESLKK